MISIVIPVYNASKYLPQCIDSVRQQSYTDWEIIIVNDASKDNSLSICTKYAQKDPRIIIINNPQNEGVEKSRYYGYSAASGEYVLYIDSDDWLCDRDILKKALIKAEETRADYVEMGVQRVMDRYGLIKKTSISRVVGLIKQPELFEKYYISFFGYNILSVNIWGKLYRKTILDKVNLEPSGYAMGEDLVYNLKLFPYLESIYIMPDIGYSYRFGGMTSRYNTHLYPDLKKLYLLKEKLIEQYNYDKASQYIKIEMKNVLRSDICQQIVFKVGTDKDIISNIAKELSDPLWERVMQIDENPDFYNDPFVKAIQEKDAEKVFLQCKEIVRKERPRRMIKKMASIVLTHI